MNRIDAKRIAETVTREQLAAMLERAKTGVKDWAAVSSVNPHFTKGKSWNIFYPVFMSGRHLVKPAITNMVHEFGDFLDDDIKPRREPRQRPDIVPVHEEPRFEVMP
jgi:hypothetical protein